MNDRSMLRERRNGPSVVCRKSIVLIEDSVLFRKALLNLMSCSGRYSVDAWSSAQLIERTDRIHCDLVVIDTVTWASLSTVLIVAIKTVGARVPLLLLGQTTFLHSRFSLLWCGVAGFVEQTASPRLLEKAIRIILSGGVWFERTLFQRAMGSTIPCEDVRPGVALDKKEAEVLGLIASGKTNKEIGAHLGYSERTIKGYVTALFHKIGGSTRSSLATYATRHGFVPSAAWSSCGNSVAT